MFKFIKRIKMKSVINNFLFAAGVVSLLGSCKKDLPVLTLDESNPKAPQLKSTESNIVLQEARENNTAVVFSWTKPSYNFNGSFKYTLQFAKAGTSFASPVEESAGTDLLKQYT